MSTFEKFWDIEVSTENAHRFDNWLRTRGGLAVWLNLEIGGSGPAFWITPANQPDGTPTQAPNWRAGNTPDRIVTDPTKVAVIKEKEMERVKLGERQKSDWRKIVHVLSRHGSMSSHYYDPDTNEQVITVPDTITPLPQWIKENQNGETDN